MLSAILEQGVIVLPLLLGAYISLKLMKLPDFALESAFLSGAVFGYLFNSFPIGIIVCGSIFGGLLVGVTTLFLNQYLKIPYLLAAIATNGLFHGINQFVLKTAVVSFKVPLIFSEILLFITLSFFSIAVAYLVLRSKLGYALAIFGDNPEFFSHYQISSFYVMGSGLLLAHGLAGLSGCLFALSNGFIDLTMGFGVVLLCLTALMLGSCFFRNSSPNVLVPLSGVIVYFFLQQGILKFGFDLKYFNAVQALIFIFFLYLKNFNLNMAYRIGRV